MGGLLGWLAVVVGLFDVTLLAGGWWLQRRSGLPRARVVATDTGAGRPLTEPLFSRQYGLAGRPDYVIEERGRIIPVEVKPSRRSPQPQPSDVLQLLAYCLLVEETWQRPPYGLLRYATGTFRIDYTPAARALLLDRIAEVRTARTGRDPAARSAQGLPRSHDDPARCAACGFRAQCDQSLA